MSGKTPVELVAIIRIKLEELYRQTDLIPSHLLEENAGAGLLSGIASIQNDADALAKLLEALP